MSQSVELCLAAPEAPEVTEGLICEGLKSAASPAAILMPHESPETHMHQRVRVTVTVEVLKPFE